MSTPNPVFTPLVSGFTFVLSTVDASGNPLPAGETESAATIGIRPDGNPTQYPAGTYQYTVVLPAGVTSATPATLATALGKPLPPGNYWAAVDQTDTLSGTAVTSSWTAEVPFSIPQPPVTPAAPTGFSVA